MPSWEVIVAIVGMIFSAGVTWGFMNARQKSTEQAHKTSETKIDQTVTDLKEAVKELRTLTTEIQVMKSSGQRNEGDIKDLEKRVQALEIEVAKLKAA
jgi:peptidoglycan hydrolase CwlO-like protein